MELLDYLGGPEVAGGKLKETGTTHWWSPNVGADNESGFTALPAGIRDYTSTYDWFGKSASYWTSTEDNEDDAFHYSIEHDVEEVYNDVYSKKAGYAVRCIKD